MEESGTKVSKREEIRRKRKKYPNVFFKKELVALFNALDNPKTTVAAFLAFFCALRISEVCKLKWKDVDLQEKRLKVVDGKNHKDGYVPISSLCIPILERWKLMNDNQEYVFPPIKEGQAYYCPHALNVDFRKMLHKAGLLIDTEKTSSGRQQHQYRFHTLRHSRCTHLLSNYVPIEKVQKFMRHDEVETTMHYTWILDRELNNMVEEVDNYARISLLPEDLSKGQVPRLIVKEEDPLLIAQKRLAKGEIGIREYKRLVGTLIDNRIIQTKANVSQQNISQIYISG